jgi:hypothetical protein
MKIVIDRRFDHWDDSLGSIPNDGNAAFDVVGLGVNAAGSLAGGLTSQIGNAISGVLTGTKKTVQEDIFLTQSVQAILTQMKGDRAKWASIIDSRLDATYKQVAKKTAANGTSSVNGTQAPSAAPKPAPKAKTSAKGSNPTPANQPAPNPDATQTTAQPYRNLSEAWDDLQTYSRQGSFVDALAELQSNVGAQAAACQADKINVKQGTAPTTRTGAQASQGTTPTTATSTSKCQVATTPGT